MAWDVQRRLTARREKIENEGGGGHWVYGMIQNG
jgi:hypothetical protein